MDDQGPRKGRPPKYENDQERINARKLSQRKYKNKLYKEDETFREATKIKNKQYYYDKKEKK